MLFYRYMNTKITNKSPKAIKKSRIFGHNSKLPLIALVTTGGTIASKLDPKTNSAMPAETEQNLISFAPEILKHANIKLIPFSNIDSSQMTPEIWLDLSKVVNLLLQDKNISGVIVTHGTDTMAEAAYFLDLTIESNKPVVITGAMRNISALSYDGPMNLHDAVIVASSEAARHWGVVVIMNQYISAARTVRKIHTSNIHGFDAGEHGYLGCVAEDKIVVFRKSSGDNQHFKLPQKLPYVALVQTYSGDDGSIIRFLIDQNISAIIIEGYGAGNVNIATFEAIKHALKKKITVIITSQLLDGLVLPLYGTAGGGAALQKAGAILAADISGPKARLLFMLGGRKAFKKYQLRHD